ncbi:MAG: hypothetical protein J3K34DRAFT_13467 [Monoraphidium minutum]|nr:MAG: hypothetical protein J3K34DRAFT_13467 [Monoraphidium minutum]
MPRRTACALVALAAMAALWQGAEAHAALQAEDGAPRLAQVSSRRVSRRLLWPPAGAPHTAAPQAAELPWRAPRRLLAELPSLIDQVARGDMVNAPLAGGAAAAFAAAPAQGLADLLYTSDGGSVSGMYAAVAAQPR